MSVSSLFLIINIAGRVLRELFCPYHRATLCLCVCVSGEGERERHKRERRRERKQEEREEEIGREKRKESNTLRSRH